MSQSSNTTTGLGIGNVIAAIVSWVTNHSIGWCIVHCLLGWFYVIYYLLGGGR